MKQSTGDRLFGIAVYMCVALITLIVLYPLVYVLSASFSDPAAILRGICGCSQSIQRSSPIKACFKMKTSG